MGANSECPGMDCLTQGHIWLQLHDTGNPCTWLSWCLWCGTGVSDPDRYDDVVPLPTLDAAGEVHVRWGWEAHVNEASS